MDVSYDDRLRSVTIGALRRLDGSIELADYDPAWTSLFDREARRITSILTHRALAIEHVGSTSVPGLAAKPIVDIVLAVADSADETNYVDDLESSGYVLRIREPDWHEHRLLKGPDTDVNVHVFTSGSAEIDRMLAFRHHLREDSDDRARYEAVKRQLAARRWRYVQQYADAKSEIVAEILGRAMPDP